MAKEIRVFCDKCGKDVYGQEYYTLPITRHKQGKSTKFPTVWLCKECFLKTSIIIANINKGE